MLEPLLTAATVVTAITALVGLLWWLVSPRVVRGVTNVCTAAVADALADLDDRVTALARTVEKHHPAGGDLDERVELLEIAVEHSHHPARLVELADLLALIRNNAPADAGIKPEEWKRS